MSDWTTIGTASELHRDGRLAGKAGALPVLVVWNGEQGFAIEDRCPHLGFPLRQGTIESGMVTCHWHHARFDLASGCALDPWADDAMAFDVRIENGEVAVRRRPEPDPLTRWARRLDEGLEHRLTLVIAKAVPALMEHDGGEDVVLRAAYRFGNRYRAGGWSSGLTVVTCMANLLPRLPAADRPLALVHALVFLADDVGGHAPRFAQPPLLAADQPPEQLASWYRRMVENRSADGAERVLATLVEIDRLDVAEATMFGAATDHVFVDEGHTVDFTNKAFEALARLGSTEAGLLTSLVRQSCLADRAEESSEWNHPDDLVDLADRTIEALGAPAGPGGIDVGSLGGQLLAEEPDVVAAALVDAAGRGAKLEELARAVAYAAALRQVRFHTNNDVADWNTVHHTFTFANGVHQAVVRRPTPELVRSVVHGALRVYLNRFLNIPAARPPRSEPASLQDLAACWDVQGAVNSAGSALYGFLGAGGSRQAAVAALGHALLQEDAGFHMYQSVEAAVTQAHAWPEGSEEGALVLVGCARFLAAHTPTRRELATLARTATRLRRGETLYEDTAG